MPLRPGPLPGATKKSLMTITVIKDQTKQSALVLLDWSGSDEQKRGVKTKVQTLKGKDLQKSSDVNSPLKKKNL